MRAWVQPLVPQRSKQTATGAKLPNGAYRMIVILVFLKTVSAKCGWYIPEKKKKKTRRSETLGQPSLLSGTVSKTNKTTKKVL